MNANHQKVDVKVVNGFVAEGHGGNPAGVVLNADRYSAQQMQAIAKGVGLSETAFVSTSQTEGFKLDFFTPNRRIAHCGHATIAAFSYLAAQGVLGEGETSKETVDGPRKVVIKEGAAYMEQLAPRYAFSSDWSEQGVAQKDVLEALNLSADKLAQGLPIAVVNTGNRFVIVAVNGAQTLAHLAPDFAKITAISDKLDVIGFYVFTTETRQHTADATTRMFAPRFAIEEESATGMAAGPLACYLHDVVNMNKQVFEIRQGEYMLPASPSVIHVELSLNAGKITSLMAGGHGKLMEERTVSLVRD
ncbi:PhzF family phenazine biosynthesis protein [Oceanimonas doudoroffii]|uniref:Phenazine biosynthesis PhzC/PhzF protein n=1 Tax=Oceanimonas doudoroffii TaxID=84158 RepID=G5CZE2_9GAMM|nr:PhzF family phenazine biosynthesis protein [Oceanimonas doudoroffii]AEQ39094.1 phenazine biosynthesis PhzC/PhzF protein [Oceanimonas doudoroffii]OXY82187.1 phenazine biosynthesis protein [Oceanimonas doudoroffii]